MASLAPYPYWQFFDDDGNPLAGGKVYTYENETATPKTAYTNAAESAQATNPIILDANGRAVIFLSGTYRLHVTDANDVPIDISPFDNVSGVGTGANQIAYTEDTGAANAYILTPNPPITAYAEGQTVDFIPENSNTGASTIQISGLTAQDIKMPNGSVLPALSLVAGTPAQLFYDGTNFILMNPSPTELFENEQTGGTYTFALTDAQHRLVKGNSGSAQTFTVPENTTTAFPLGSVIPLYQYGAGQITIAAAGTVTIRSPETLKLRKQYSTAALTKIGTDEWLLAGDLEIV